MTIYTSKSTEMPVDIKKIKKKIKRKISYSFVRKIRATFDF